jgi:hypothetical protein
LKAKAVMKVRAGMIPSPPAMTSMLAAAARAALGRLRASSAVLACRIAEGRALPSPRIAMARPKAVCVPQTPRKR